MPVPLSLATLGRPAGQGRARPSYARGDLSAGIVHFGVGATFTAPISRSISTG